MKEDIKLDENIHVEQEIILNINVKRCMAEKMTYNVC